VRSIIFTEPENYFSPHLLTDATDVATIRTMTLAEYIDGRNIAVAEFANDIGVSPQTVYRYLSGERTPRGKMLRRIMKATAGAVQPLDFLEQDAA